MEDSELGIAEPAQAEPVEPADGSVAPAASEDHFFDPSQLPQELQGQWKRMQGAYTKKMQNVARYREAADLVERFNSDPEFARMTIQQRAQALGLNIAQPGQQFGAMQQTGDKPPQEFVEAVKANLSPELQWMAPTLAASQWAATKMMMQPLQEQQRKVVASTRDEKWNDLVEQLSQKAPGWEEKEDDMNELMAFLQSDKLTDRRFGSKLELIYKMVAGEGQATAEAARRMAQAARFRNPAGSPTASPEPNIADQVKQPKNNQEAWDRAAKYALSQMARNGIKVS